MSTYTGDVPITEGTSSKLSMETPEYIAVKVLEPVGTSFATSSLESIVIPPSSDQPSNTASVVIPGTVVIAVYLATFITASPFNVPNSPGLKVIEYFGTTEPE